jgi:hypothetical protein
MERDQVLIAAARKMPCKGCAGREVVGNRYCVVQGLEVAGEVRRIAGVRGCTGEALEVLLSRKVLGSLNGKGNV